MTDLREEQVNLRATEEQVSRWRQAAERERRTLSDWMRLMLDDSASGDSTGRTQPAKNRSGRAR